MASRLRISRRADSDAGPLGQQLRSGTAAASSATVLTTSHRPGATRRRRAQQGAPKAAQASAGQTFGSHPDPPQSRRLATKHAAGDAAAQAAAASDSKSSGPRDSGAAFAGSRTAATVAAAAQGISRYQQPLQTGEAAVEGVTDPYVRSTLIKRATALDLLLTGHPQSYVDFFLLGHRADPSKRRLPGEPEHQVTLSVDEAERLRGNLAKGERAKRLGHLDEVFTRYSALADHFIERAGDADTALFFYERCLEVAEVALPVHRARAHRNLCAAFGRLQQWDPALQQALAFLQATGEARQHPNVGPQAGPELQELEQEARVMVARAARRRAKQLEREGLLEEALQLHVHCLDEAQSGGSRQLEAASNLSAGQVCVALGRPSEALPFLKAFLILSESEAANAKDAQRAGAAAGAGKGTTAEEEEDEAEAMGGRAVGAAYGSLATAYRTLGQDAEAVGALEGFLQATQEAGDAAAEAVARSNLGALLSQQHQFDEAVAHLRCCFDIRRQILAGEETAQASPGANLGAGGKSGPSPMKLLDDARIKLGAARANARMGCYLRSIAFDLPALLSWKCGRSGAIAEASHE